MGCPVTVTKLLFAAGLWLAALVFCLTWIAARHPLLAGLTATVQVTSAWALVASYMIGPAPVDLRWSPHPGAWPGDFRYDYAQAWGWTSGAPWELFGVVAGIFTWCLLRRSLRKRKIARRAQAAAPPVVVVPWPPQQNNQPATPALRQ